MTEINKLELIEKVAQENSLERIEALGHVKAAVRMAGAMGRLRELIRGPVLEQVASLAGSPLGFLTDKDYPAQHLLDPAIECLLRGGRWTGNEFNVIAGRCYMTLQFYERRVGELVQNLRIREHVPERHKDGAVVGMQATWIYEGQEMRQDWIKTADADNRIAVRVNSGMGIDAILGKARRKLLARIYREVTGSAWASVDASSDADVIEQSPELDETLAQRITDESMGRSHQRHRAWRQAAHEIAAPDDTELVCQALDQIENASMIGDVKAIERAALEQLVTKDARAEVQQYAADRIADIRACRGERTNEARDAQAPKDV